MLRLGDSKMKVPRQACREAPDGPAAPDAFIRPGASAISGGGPTGTHPIDTEASLAARLAEDPGDGEAALALSDLLIRQGRPVPPDLQETVLRRHLARDPARHDLAFRLAMVLMELGRPVPPALEEKALRHAIAEEPGRLDLLDRLATVALETCLAPLRQDAPPPAMAEPAVLERARAHLGGVAAERARAGLPDYGVRWEEYVARMRAAIAGFATPVEALRHAQSRIGFDHRLKAAEALRYHRLYRRELASAFPRYATALDAFDDPAGSAPDTQFLVGTRHVSNITAYHAWIVLSCLSLLPAPGCVLELGGGYGGPARAWLTNPIAQPRCYIIVDIAESLFFAEAVLASVFGPEAVLYVPDATPLDPGLLDRHRVILCPIERLRAVEGLPVDLVVNTGSLQEMSEAWIDFYMAWLDRQRTRFFYSLNYAVQPVGALGESINLWSPRPSEGWLARHLRWNPGFLRMQAERNFLEAVYEKRPAALAQEDASARLAVLAERTMSGQVACEYLDLFRRSKEPGTALLILRRMMGEMPFHPKEALWLGEWLRREGGTVATTHAAEIAGYVETLAAEREAGREGTT